MCEHELAYTDALIDMQDAITRLEGVVRGFEYVVRELGESVGQPTGRQSAADQPPRLHLVTDTMTDRELADDTFASIAASNPEPEPF